MAGSTSGVPWKTKSIRQGGCIKLSSPCVCSLSPSVVCVWETAHPGPPSGTQRLSFSVPRKCGPRRSGQGCSGRRRPRPAGRSSSVSIIIAQSVTMEGKLLPYLDERQHFVLHDCRRVVFGGDDFDQHTVHEVPVGHLDVKSVAAVFHTRLQNLQSVRSGGGGDGTVHVVALYGSFHHLGTRAVSHLLTVSASITSL